MKKYIVHIKTPGHMFTKPNGETVRTPIKFEVNEKERKLCESLIRMRSYPDYEITEGELTIRKTKVPKLSLIKSNASNQLSIKIQQQ